MTTQFPVFATCPKGLEGILLTELQGLGATDTKETVAGIGFTASLASVYRICLWSRLANRILLRVGEFPFVDADALYAGVKAIQWHEHMSAATTFAVDFSGRTDAIKHTHFGALKVKDAIVDYFRDRSGARPSVETDQPELRLNVRAARGSAIVSIDMSGESLHRRGYRAAGGAAPLKENLAAALLVRAGWPAIAAKGGCLLDPMCGSGTLLIEGAAIAAGLAPGLRRKRWGFAGWLGHEPDTWTKLLDETKTDHDTTAGNNGQILGYDASGHAVQMAEENIRAAGLVGRIRVRRGELANFAPPLDSGPGLVITNPPFGERLGNETDLGSLYRHLGTRLCSHFQGWQAAVITGNPELGKTMGIRARKTYRLFNGAIPAKLLLFDVQPNWFVTDRNIKTPERPSTAPKQLSDGAQMVANRLTKNLKRLSKWAIKHEISSYRIYDADIPEYSAAIDRYADRVHIAEYQAPADIDPAVASRRVEEILDATESVLGVGRDQIILKQRKRQPRNEQYQKQDERAQLLEVSEHAAMLLVNLHDYVDTGLFLDHRPVRKRISELAAGKRFLNLYCYTAASTVHAALGGARYSVSVDLSPRYLAWARNNLALNGIGESRHKLIEADCQDWLSGNQDVFDLILLDPPTFSNSKRTENVLDLQRDHADLIRATMRCLAPDGLLIFSTNRRKFKLDETLQDTFTLENVTQWSLDEDFRGSKIHQCWFVRQRQKSAWLHNGSRIN
jgi:23S rRNA (guanine2445-N2)-methyltransferase / 23S rRNA (guanine2069-N7)-methyltransferase